MALAQRATFVRRGEMAALFQICTFSLFYYFSAGEAALALLVE